MNSFSKFLLLAAIALPLFAEDYPPCPHQNPPESRFDAPTCADYRLDQELILAAKFGDRGAIEQLKQRHDTAYTWYERQDIAAALLHRVDDDSIYWDEIYQRAADAVRSPRNSENAGLMFDALLRAGDDCRSHALMIEALDSDDSSIAGAGVLGLAEQHDEASLILIEQKLKSASKDWVASVASSLSAFYSDAADAIALPYLAANMVADYRQNRDETGPLVRCLEGHAPRNLTDHPRCADEEANSVLIAAVKRGERSAIKRLTERYKSASTFAERHSIAETLLRRVDDDSVYWNELYPHAENAIRLLGTPGLKEWSAERGFAPDAYDRVAASAFFAVRSDRRAHALLMRALAEAQDSAIVAAAIVSLGQQQDMMSLPAIDQALERVPPDEVAWSLSSFHNPAADAIARRHLSAANYEIYELRDDQ